MKKQWYVDKPQSIHALTDNECPVRAIQKADRTLLLNNPPDDLMIVQAESEPVAKFIHMIYHEYEDAEQMIFCEICNTAHIGPYIRQKVQMDKILKDLDE